MTTIRVAVTQAEPAWLDLARSVQRACKLITYAPNNGAKIIAFAEAWIPGYPAWIWSVFDAVLATKYIYNSLAIESEEMNQIKATAKKHSIAVVLGFSERSPSNSIYLAQAIISPQGELVLHRRKIKATHMERTVFGDGSGNDLTSVVELDFGALLGRIKVASQGEVIHISMWPPVDPATGVDHPGLWSMTADGCQNLSQTYAIEGGAYVLHSTSPGGGHSCIIGPDGRRLTPPLGDGKPDMRGIQYGYLNLTKVVTNKGFIDVVGHYSRPDLLWLGVDKQQKEAVIPKVLGKRTDSEKEMTEWPDPGKL
ncbi:carbon-nitrogen hydrolase [Daldinia sp. FL1419]|nr:carbon-nitrogen hydrolase [Daldinia sp. FL1419]